MKIHVTFATLSLAASAVVLSQAQEDIFNPVDSNFSGDQFEFADAAPSDESRQVVGFEETDDDVTLEGDQLNFFLNPDNIPEVATGIVDDLNDSIFNFQSELQGDAGSNLFEDVDVNGMDSSELDAPVEFDSPTDASRIESPSAGFSEFQSQLDEGDVSFVDVDSVDSNEVAEPSVFSAAESESISPDVGLEFDSTASDVGGLIGFGAADDIANQLDNSVSDGSLVDGVVDSMDESGVNSMGMPADNDFTFSDAVGITPETDDMQSMSFVEEGDVNGLIPSGFGEETFVASAALNGENHDSIESDGDASEEEFDSTAIPEVTEVASESDRELVDEFNQFVEKIDETVAENEGEGHTAMDQHTGSEGDDSGEHRASDEGFEVETSNGIVVLPSMLLVVSVVVTALLMFA